MRPVLEIGGTHVTAALADPDTATVTRRARRPLDARGTAEQILGAVVRCAGALETPAGQVWGVAVPGPFDYDKGIARYEAVGKFDDLYGIDVRSVLLDGVWPRPADTVFLNDAHAFLLGEWRAGAARGHRRCVGITLGSGVGSAFGVDGEVRREGPGVPPQGRVDLLKAGGRPLEDSVSRRAILARYGGDDPTAPLDVRLDVREVAARARAGERRARQVLDEAFTTLGAVLAPHLRDFDATALVVGGAMASSWDLIRPALRAGLGGTAVALRRAALGEDAALIGTAAHVAAVT
ncbi:ROK family protein [Streptomyces sp. WAC 01529]|uniref:ROK family protein n=1 Tax=Streptomyces sp. WAC 01529 TaxID=2203205 RepID=UPI000F718681|nr:ROK family protein [Streptomyces sp. WAC 01529]AZM51347.1 ROK family protein [Streptomyces sp. WAC 01529]